MCDGKGIIMPLDTSEINMDNHRNRIKAGTGLGATGNNEDLGFFIHASLVMDATTETS